MKVGMFHHVLPPGVKNCDQTNIGAWIFRSKLTPFAPVINRCFYDFSRVFCVTVRQMLTPLKVAKWVANFGAY